ncbi:MAG: tandem-95 repeat protein [Rhodoferax sp.]|nr:tandem-95 repeat protein [Rhodoferax sp.]
MTVVVRSNDTDPEGDTLTVTAVTNGANGSVTIDATSGNPVYTPNLNFVGTDTFTYTISDGNPPPGGTDTATVSVTVGPNANDAPDAINDIASTTEDTPVTVVVRSNDTDPEGDTLTVTAVTNGANGSVTIDATSGNPVYTPNLNFVGTDTFTLHHQRWQWRHRHRHRQRHRRPQRQRRTRCHQRHRQHHRGHPRDGGGAQQRHRPRGRHPDGHRRHQRRQRLGHD